MTSEKLRWCASQNKGIMLVEPNEMISESYVKESQEDFDMIKKSNSKWKAVTAYYSCYNAVYAALMKAGVKCEIHDCTIALMDMFGFEQDDINFINSLKDERIKVQYYLKPASLDIDERKILSVLDSCKELMREMNDDKINDIRSKLRKMGSQS